jgi:chromosomal replication initiation ATPase DnaA
MSIAKHIERMAFHQSRMIHYSHLVRRALDFSPKQSGVDRPDIACILQAVSASRGISVAHIMGRSRLGPVFLARHIAIYISRRLTSHGIPDLARAFILCDKAVSSAIRSIKGRIETEPKLAIEIAHIEALCRKALEQFTK